MTQFYLYPTSPIELDLMLDVLASEGVNKRIKTERISLPFGYAESYSIAVNCEYEKLEFIKYLVKKKQEQIERLERCPVKDKNELTTCGINSSPNDIAEKLGLQKIYYPKGSIGAEMIRLYEQSEEIKRSIEKECNKNIGTSILYRIWQKYFKRG